MKVRDLVNILSLLDQDFEVIAVSDDDTKGPTPFEIEGASMTNVVRDRDGEGRPTIRADNERGIGIVTIDLLADF